MGAHQTGSSPFEVNEDTLPGSNGYHQILSIGRWYEPLNEEKSEIRVLCILPDDESRSIRCKLACYSMSPEQVPAYTALSYCWGDTNDFLAIMENKSTVFVTRNLETALWELRREGYRNIWVDALCISQYDNGEERHQILRIGDIYRNSVETVAWLSPDDAGHAQRIFNNLESLYSDCA